MRGATSPRLLVPACCVCYEGWLPHSAAFDGCVIAFCVAAGNGVFHLHDSEMHHAGRLLRPADMRPMRRADRTRGWGLG